MRNKKIMIALPSSSSKLHHPALSTVFPGSTGKNFFDDPRRLCYDVSNYIDVVFFRGRDIPSVVDAGIADVGVTGYDVIVEYALQSANMLDVRLLAHRRRSFVALVSSRDRQVTRIYTEYPAITSRWARSTATYDSAELISLNGSSEGIVSRDPASAGVLLVTTGRTLRANGLFVKCPLLWTDLCAVQRKNTDNEAVRVGGVSLHSLQKLELPAFAENIPMALPDRR
jgi:ATP phosphoribosyltransferase